MKRIHSVLFAAGVLLVSSAVMRADTLVGGETTVALNSSTVATLSSLFSIGVVPPATLNGLNAMFPITAATTTTITHSGGLSFTGTHTPIGVGTTAAIENFVINLTSGTISGLVVINGTAMLPGVTLFDVGPGLSLTLDSQLAGDLSSVYGIPNLKGAPIGTATVNAATPEPSTLSMLALGAASMGTMVRRRFKRTA